MRRVPIPWTWSGGTGGHKLKGNLLQTDSSSFPVKDKTHIFKSLAPK